MGKIFLFSLQNYHFVQRKLFIGSEQFHSDFDTKKHLLGDEVCIYNTKNKKGIVQVLWEVDFFSWFSRRSWSER